MMAYDQYKKLDIAEDNQPLACPVCGSKAELWRYSEAPDAPTSTVVCCSNGEVFGPQSGLAGSGCLLYMPPPEFYLDRIASAVKYWNEYTVAIEAQRRKRHWHIAQVLRGAVSTEDNL